MNKKEQSKQLAEFKRIAEEILSSEKDTRDFLVEAGINTKTGRLTKHYSGTRLQVVAKFK